MPEQKATADPAASSRTPGEKPCSNPHSPPTRRVSHPSSEAYLLYSLGLKTQPRSCTCKQRVNPNYHHPWSKKAPWTAWALPMRAARAGTGQGEVFAKWPGGPVRSWEAHTSGKWSSEAHPVCTPVPMSSQLPAQQWCPSPCGTGLPQPGHPLWGAASTWVLKLPADGQLALQLAAATTSASRALCAGENLGAGWGVLLGPWGWSILAHSRSAPPALAALHPPRGDPSCCCRRRALS